MLLRSKDWANDGPSSGGPDRDRITSERGRISKGTCEIRFSLQAVGLGHPVS